MNKLPIVMTFGNGLKVILNVLKLAKQMRSRTDIGE
jgi:hypothetical protein